MKVVYIEDLDNIYLVKKIEMRKLEVENDEVEGTLYFKQDIDKLSSVVFLGEL